MFQGKQHKQVQGSNLGLTEPHTKVRFMFMYTRDMRNSHSVPWTQSGSCTPAAIQLQSQHQLLKWSCHTQAGQAGFCSLSGSLHQYMHYFAYQRYPIPSHTPRAMTFWSTAWTACQPGTWPCLQDFPVWLPGRETKFHVLFRNVKAQLP